MKNNKSRSIQVSWSLLAGTLVIMLFFSGCATIRPASNEDASGIISLLNNGKAEKLTLLSADSFLLDAEILHGSTMTGDLWNGLTGSGFTLNNPVVIESRSPLAADAAFFGSSVEVDVFFSRYLPAQSTLFRIGSDDTEIVLILGPSEKGISRIIAFGGPF